MQTNMQTNLNMQENIINFIIFKYAIYMSVNMRNMQKKFKEHAKHLES
jgi:hypothetical protein